MRLIRSMQVAVVGVVVGLVCVLSLSDSVLLPMKRLSWAARRLLRGVEDGLGFDAASRPDIPFGGDTIAHFVGWTVVGLVACGLATTALRRFNLFLALFGLSALLELGQRYLSWSRSAELTDLMANGIGLALGFLAFTVAEMVLMSAVPTLATRAGGLLGRLFPRI